MSGAGLPRSPRAVAREPGEQAGGEAFRCDQVALPAGAGEPAVQARADLLGGPVPDPRLHSGVDGARPAGVHRWSWSARPGGALHAGGQGAWPGRAPWPGVRRPSLAAVTGCGARRGAGEWASPGPGARDAGAVTAEPRLPSTPSWVRVMVPSG